jgi:hypothetical protein
MPDNPPSKTIHALLVGIDRYPAPVPGLSGCVNDVEAFATFLRARAAGVDPRIRLLRDEEATREAIIAGFRSHLAQAKPGDVAVFYYAGHGSQEQAPPEFWQLEPDKLDETLVCHDSRRPGSWDLADKELARLIDEVAATGAHVVVILDCCHSGSGTRVVRDQETAVRRAPTDLRERPIASFLVGPEEADRLAGTRGLAEDRTDWPVGRHVLFAACRDDQEASEFLGGLARGAFSYFLGDTLRTATGPLTYRNLFGRTDDLLRSAVSGQAPQLEASRTEDLDALFLDGAVRRSEPYYLVAAEGDVWTLRAGAVHGLPAAAGAEAPELALFPFDATPEQLRDRAGALGKARVVAVGPTSCRVVLEGIADPPRDATFKAILTRFPLPALAVRLEGDADAVALAREALDHVGPDGTASVYVREAKIGELPEYRLIARGDQYLLTRPKPNIDTGGEFPLGVAEPESA